MAISTAGDLINFCFRVSGINGQGQSPSAEDSADALTTLAAMIGQWQRKRWLTYALTETAVVSTGANSYTIGAASPVLTPATMSSFPTSPTGLAPGTVWSNGGVLMTVPGGPPIWPSLLPGALVPGSAGAFAVARPDRIEAAFVRYLGASIPIDIPLGIIESAEDFASIAIKTGFQAWPAAVWYESSFPVGVLHFWPVPSAGSYEMHIFTKTALPLFANLTDVLSLPPEYIEALKYSLVVRLAADWGMEPKPAHVAAMKAALATVRMANTQVPMLRMPGDIPGSARRNGTNMAAFISGRW